jgi:hypothetical protein
MLIGQQLTNCIQRNMEIPPVITRWSKIIESMMTSELPYASQLTVLMVRLANIRSSAVSKESIHSKDFVALLQAIDYDLENWMLTLPPSWTFVTHTSLHDENVYADKFATYPSFSIAAAWNDYRTLRCIVNDILLTHFDAIASGWPVCDNSHLFEQRQKAVNTIKSCCTDICLSAPFFLGRLGHPCCPKSGAGDLQMMWALFVCACMHCISKEQRMWAVKQLESIGHHMGIHQALPLAELMKSKIHLVRSPGKGGNPEWESAILTKSWYEELRNELFLGK